MNRLKKSKFFYMEMFRIENESKMETENIIDDYLLMLKSFKFKSIKLDKENEGGSSIILNAKRKSKKYIIKFMKKDFKHLFDNEIQILYTLNSSDFNCFPFPKIIVSDINSGYFFAFKKQKNTMDLFSFKSKFILLSENEKFKIIESLCIIIYNLHELGFIHMDLKLENFIINQKTYKVSIIDWGRCIDISQVTEGRLSPKKNFLFRSYGTNYYTEPQLFGISLSKYTISMSMDVYALGMSIYLLFVDFFPFAEQDLRELNREEVLFTYKKIHNEIQKNENISSNVKIIITQMLCPRDQRLTMKNIISYLNKKKNLFIH